MVSDTRGGRDISDKSADHLWPLLEAIVEFGRVRKKAIASCEGHVRRTHQSRATDGVCVVKELAAVRLGSKYLRSTLKLGLTRDGLGSCCGVS
jgi:hypothetical protein